MRALTHGLGLVVLAIVTMAPLSDAAEQPDKETARIWEKLQKGGGAPEAGRKIIEGFPLVEKPGAVTSGAVAVAAVLTFQLGPESLGDYLAAAQLMAPFKLFELSAERGTRLAGTEREKHAWDFINSLLEASGKKVMQARDMVQREPDKWRTRGMRNACLMSLYVAGEGAEPIRQGVSDFAADRLLAVNAQYEDTVSWETLKGTIDKGNPVILLRKDSCLVALGYLVEREIRQVMFYDPANAAAEDLVARSMKSPRPQSSDPATRAYVDWMRKRHVYVDRRVQLDQPLPVGLAARNWDALGQSSAIYLSDWGPNVEKVYPKMLEYVKQKAGEKQ